MVFADASVYSVYSRTFRLLRQKRSKVTMTCELCIYVFKYSGSVILLAILSNVEIKLFTVWFYVATPYFKTMIAGLVER